MAGTYNRLLAEAIIVIHSEREVFVVKNTGNIKGNLGKSSGDAPIDITKKLKELKYLISKI